ncbi:hypothetical protein AB0C27_40515 [Nonomuraea sp. NPDC048882]|uniref:hypothetical protein n=1 Tax=Nonomuraea sp. NPDC048882 TaxID=3154347 RepID=UPI0033E75BFD
MAKQGGMGDGLLVAGYDLSGDIGSLGRIGGGPAALDMTAINVEAMERIGGLRDGSFEFSSFFNPAVNRAHPVLSALPTADVIQTYLRGTGAGRPAACLVAKQANYDGSRGTDGSFSFSVQALANGFGTEWGVQLTDGIATHTEADESASLDGGTSSAHGLQAWLHVLAFTGDDVTIKLQESSDDGGSDAWADVTGGSFTQITAGPASERIQTGRSLTVERYLRVATTTSAGFSDLDFLVVVTRNLTAVTF